MLLWSLLLGCSSNGCFESDLDLWCTNEEADEPERAEDDCGTPEGELSYRCGDYDVIEHSHGQYGDAHYFDRDHGTHVATEYWTDDSSFCGEGVYWYGKRIECDRTCKYEGFTSTLPRSGFVQVSQFAGRWRMVRGNGAGHDAKRAFDR